ncbi:MAG: hypothetical protein ACD_23C00568G0002, partial [uncultured bacterium]
MSASKWEQPPVNGALFNGPI